jgi:hypothetical protein
MSFLANSTASPRAAAIAWPDLLPVAVVLLYGAGVELVAASLGARVSWTLYLPYAGAAMLALGLAGLAGLCIEAALRHPGEGLVTAVWAGLERRGITAPALLRSLPLLLALPVFLSLFSSFKSLIPSLQPFAWDQGFADLDRVLHAGQDPWRLLLPLLDLPRAIRVLDFLYHSVWSFAIVGLWTWQAVDRRRPQLRAQILLALPITWIALGSIGGAMFSSAGPCYFAEVGGSPERFAPLLARLAEIDADAPLISHTAQHALWRLHSSASIGFGGGISAMPSVHVASAWLLVLATARCRRGAAALAAAFFVAIVVGSVVLGWHYAVDAYAGAALAWVVWAGCGALVRRLSAAAPPSCARALFAASCQNPRTGGEYFSDGS